VTKFQKTVEGDFFDSHCTSFWPQWLTSKAQFSDDDDDDDKFLSEIINIRDDVFSLQFSGGVTLSWHELNAIELYLAIDKQTW